MLDGYIPLKRDSLKNAIKSADRIEVALDPKPSIARWTSIYFEITKEEATKNISELISCGCRVHAISSELTGNHDLFIREGQND